MTSAVTPEARIALVFHHARSCSSGRVRCSGGRVMFAAIRFSLARARSETLGPNSRFAVVDGDVLVPQVCPTARATSAVSVRGLR
ncbi:hypothetical protein N8I84_40275 [Streptomyces cynarae]|uniref:Uncharacterized protein n=1 Tax=Streptomyces cynarae TaxID=2981134 RepID=A0ABY6ECC3_9ACTN|nr:hypothetical protein [Streptomyces cynarae]UXY24224.1 hypothetical protein N8I84_40275 [Streptomyces cynarae]